MPALHTHTHDKLTHYSPQAKRFDEALAIARAFHAAHPDTPSALATSQGSASTTPRSAANRRWMPLLHLARHCNLPSHLLDDLPGLARARSASRGSTASISSPVAAPQASSPASGPRAAVPPRLQLSHGTPDSSGGGGYQSPMGDLSGLASLGAGSEDGSHHSEQ